MAYSIGMSITQLADNGLSTLSTQQRHEIFWIVAFSGAIVVSIGMVIYNLLCMGLTLGTCEVYMTIDEPCS